MRSDWLLELENISFGYPGSQTSLLENFSLSLQANQKVGLIGPNGSGKTTLFHLIMGLHQPRTGQILLNGEPVSGKEKNKNLRKDIGLLFQDADDQLFSPTVLEDVCFGPLNLGFTPRQAKEQATSVMECLGLTELADRTTHKLSGGEKKLVSLATILVMQPKAMLLDEPTNNLDPDTRHKLIHILRELKIAYIIISHDYDFLADTCADIYAMREGKAVECSKTHFHNHSHAHPHGDLPHHHD